MAKIEIRELGPIHHCELELKDFTILTGPQARGKSTIARAIYFCRTAKQDIFAQITHRQSEDEYETSILNGVAKRLRNKFLRIFGSSWSVDREMKIVYTYGGQETLEVYLEEDRNHPYRNFVKIAWGGRIYDLLQKYGQEKEYLWDREEARLALRQEIQDTFHDPYETIYIPAGRSLITVLTDRLAGLLDSDDRKLDECMRSYIRLTLDKRADFQDGIEGLLSDKLHTTQTVVDRKPLDRLQKIMEQVLQGKYRYRSGEEQLALANHQYVKINFASSGQQETVWVFNLLYDFLLEREPIFLIIEEPEAHLYPDAQKLITEALGLFGHARHQVFVTTHSPYILGEFNNLLYASRIPEERRGELPIDEDEILSPERTQVLHINNNSDVIYGLSKEGFIRSELIDGASDAINDEMDRLMEIFWSEGERDENK